MKSLKLLILLIIIAFFVSCKGTKNVATKTKLSEKELITFRHEFAEGLRHKMHGEYVLSLEKFSNCLIINPESAATMYELALINELAGETRNAIILAEKSVISKPSNNWYKILLADLHIRISEIDKAVDIYQDLVSKNPKRIDYKFEFANLLTETGNFKKALETYNQIEEIQGVDAEVSLSKNEIFVRTENSSALQAELQKLVAFYPYEFRYVGMLAEYYTSQGNYDKAKELYDNLLIENPNSGIIHLSLANYYRNLNDKAKSLANLKIAFAAEDVSINSKMEVIVARHTFYKDVIDNDSIVDDLVELLAIAHPNEARVYALQVDILMQQKKYGLAIDKLRRVVKLSGNDFATWERLLMLELETGNYRQLHDDGAEAIELFPMQPTAYLYFGIGCHQLQKYETGLEAFSSGYDLVVDNEQLIIQFLIYLGQTNYKLRKLEKAFKTFEDVLLIDPENLYVLNNYSYYLSLEGKRLEKAEKMSLKCVRSNPSSPSYRDTYGWVLFRLGKFEEAKVQLLQAIDSGGSTNAAIIEHYGDVLFRLGEPDKALMQWENAKELGGDSETLLQKIEQKKLSD